MSSSDDHGPVVLPLLGSLLLTMIIQTTFFFISYYFQIDRVSTFSDCEFVDD